MSAASGLLPAVQSDPNAALATVDHPDLPDPLAEMEPMELRDFVETPESADRLLLQDPTPAPSSPTSAPAKLHLGLLDPRDLPETMVLPEIRDLLETTDSPADRDLVDPPDHLDQLDNLDQRDLPVLLETSDPLLLLLRVAPALLVALELVVAPDSLAALETMDAQDPLALRATEDPLDNPAPPDSPEPQENLECPVLPEAATTAHPLVWPPDIKRRKSNDWSGSTSDHHMFFVFLVFCMSNVSEQ